MHPQRFCICILQIPGPVASSSKPWSAPCATLLEVSVGVLLRSPRLAINIGVKAYMYVERRTSVESRIEERKI